MRFCFWSHNARDFFNIFNQILPDDGPSWRFFPRTIDRVLLYRIKSNWSCGFSSSWEQVWSLWIFMKQTTPFKQSDPTGIRYWDLEIVLLLIDENYTGALLAHSFKLKIVNDLKKRVHVLSMHRLKWKVDVKYNVCALNTTFPKGIWIYFNDVIETFSLKILLPFSEDRIWNDNLQFWMKGSVMNLAGIWILQW